MEIDDFIKVYNNVLDKKIISKFLLYANESKQFQNAPIETKQGTMVNTDIRDVKTLPLNDNNPSLTNVHWYNYFNNCFIQNLERYRNDTNSEYLHYEKYFEMNVLKYHKDNFYTWHTDHGFKTPRTMSVILFCNDEYEGGEIFFKLPNQNDFIIQGEVGDLVLFPSNFMYAHCVKPVTKGERITVVGVDCLMSANILPLFSQPLFSTEVELDNQELNLIEENLRKEKINHSEINKLSEDPIKNKFYTGPENILHKNQYKNLAKVIINSIKTFNDLYLKYNTDFVITKSWVAFSPVDSSCEIHRHENSFLSGVIYIKAENNSGKIEFENFNHRDILVFPRNDNTIYNIERYWIEPKPGLLLLFPSNLYHRVHKNKSGKDRISVSFDIMPTYFINKFKHEA